MSEKPRYTGSEDDLRFARLLFDSDGNYVCGLDYESEINPSTKEWELVNLNISRNDRYLTGVFNLVEEARAVGIETVLASDETATWGNYIETIPPNHILLAGVFGHEIAHAQGKMFGGLNELVDTQYDLDRLLREDVKFMEAFSVFKYLPNSREHFINFIRGPFARGDGIRTMQSTYWEFERLRKRIFEPKTKEKKKRSPYEFSVTKEINPRDMQRYADLLGILSRSIPGLEPEQAREILTLPVRIIEWLANTGAIELFRDIERRLDIDLLGRTYNYPGLPKPYSIEEFLNEGVRGTYGAPEHLKIEEWTQAARYHVRNTLII